MVMYAKIRWMFYREHLSISEIQRRTTLSRNTIKKWLKEPGSTGPKYQRASKVIGKLTPFEPRLLLSLEADSRRPKRDRRTALMLFNLFGFDSPQLAAFIVIPNEVRDLVKIPRCARNDIAIPRSLLRGFLFEIRQEGYTGGYSILTDFVRSWRKHSSTVISKSAFVPLKFELGEAFQFGWSEEWLVIGGIHRKILAAHTKLCQSCIPAIRLSYAKP